MRSNTFKGAAALVLSIGLVPTAFTQAQAAPAPTPGHFTRAPIGGLASLRSQLPALKDAAPQARADALRLLGQAPSTSSLVGATGIKEMTSQCPTGQSRSAVYSHESFEAGLPFPVDSFGFTVETGAGAPQGSGWAHSSLPSIETIPATEMPFNIVTSNRDAVPQTGRVYLSFAYRGVFAADGALVGVNTDGGFLTPTPTWTTVNLDITSEATTAMLGDGTVDMGFAHFADVAAGSFDVDDVTIYGCSAPPPAPNSGVRGDWTGQGTVDLLATRSDGTLWVYEGKGTGMVGSGVKVGTGWSSATWKGSPGDVNGDRRTDLLARRSDGTLWFYPGKGNGVLGQSAKVGTGWNTMTSIATPGDFDLDGRPDLLARRSDGTLHLYRILATGGVRYARQIGTGWNGMSSILGMGDLNGDKRGDVVAVRSDGVMFSYLSAGTKLGGAKQVSAGWKIMTLLTSPGDLNKDGRGDLIARRGDGTLWLYPGRAGGGVYSGKQVSSGWNIMSSVL